MALASDNRIEFRIGVYQGDIIVEDGDIFGDGVNVAPRLEGLADPSGICLSARVQEDSPASSTWRSRTLVSRFRITALQPKGAVR